jgi:hypothetical protein
VSTFVDTGAFYALAVRDDDHHQEAAAFWRRTAPGGGFVTSDAVLVETWTLLNARCGRREAMRYWEGVQAGVVAVLALRRGDAERAWAIANRFADQTYSIVDCLSFALMERMGIRRAFAFDRHFRSIRIGRAWTRPFDVVP